MSFHECKIMYCMYQLWADLPDVQQQSLKNSKDFYTYQSKRLMDWSSVASLDLLPSRAYSTCAPRAGIPVRLIPAPGSRLHTS